MSFYRNIVQRGLGPGIAAALTTALLTAACGAGMVVVGLWPLDRAWLAVCLAWLLAAFVGGRFVAAGEGGALLSCVLVAALSLGALWLFGLTTPGTADAAQRLWYGVSALAGAVLAAAIPRKKRRRRKRERSSKR